MASTDRTHEHFYFNSLITIKLRKTIFGRRNALGSPVQTSEVGNNRFSQGEHKTIH